jgi:2'-5' RNA ligase
MASASASATLKFSARKVKLDDEEGTEVWADWTDQTYRTVKTKETKEEWNALMADIATELFVRKFTPTKRTKTFHLCMAYAVLTAQPYRYLRDFYGCEQFKGNKEGLRQEVLRIQQDEEYMLQWDDWIQYQKARKTLEFAF